MSAANSDEARYRSRVDSILKAFAEEGMQTNTAAACLASLFPIASETEETGFRGAMTMLLQDLAEFPESRAKIAAWVVNTILNTWHQIRTGEEVIAAATALQCRGHVIIFHPDDGTFSIDGHGPYSGDDILDEASRL